jgi:hypothetical protein
MKDDALMISGFHGTIPVDSKERTMFDLVNVDEYAVLMSSQMVALLMTLSGSDDMNDEQVLLYAFLNGANIVSSRGHRR